MTGVIAQGPVHAGTGRAGHLHDRHHGRQRGHRPVPAAIQAQHAHNLLRLARVNAALSAWDEYDANQLLPPDRRRPLPRPELPRGGPTELQLMLVQRIGEVEELFGRG